MPPSVGKWVLNTVFTVVIGISLVVGVAVLKPRVETYRLLRAKRDALERATLEQQQELARTQRMQTRFKEDPEFVEHIARQNKRVRPGEITFIFDEPSE